MGTCNPERDSIFLSVKKMLGMGADYNAFDTDILTHINSVFLILAQLGVGPGVPFFIEGSEEKWTDFMEDISKINLVKSYMYLKVRLLFDPPNVGVLHEAMERQISEFEWRLNVQAETPTERSVIKDEADELDYDDEEWDRHHYD